VNSTATTRSGGSRHKARRSAVQALYQWQLTQQEPTEIESHFVLDHEMHGVDLEYFHSLIREIPLHLHELDDHLIPHLDRELMEVDPVERAILRIGAYELEFRLEIPYRVILDEAIELAKVFGAEHGHKYVNAILDKVASGLRAEERAARDTHA
jgi:N utilization substance protein B